MKDFQVEPQSQIIAYQWHQEEEQINHCRQVHSPQRKKTFGLEILIKTFYNWSLYVICTVYRE